MADPRRGRNRACTIVMFILFLVLLAVFIVWVSLQPHKPKYYMEHVSISQLNTSEDKHVGATLHVKMSTRNPNKKIDIYYDRILAYLLYNHDEIGQGMMPVFYQPHKNTTANSLTIL